MNKSTKTSKSREEDTLVSKQSPDDFAYEGQLEELPGGTHVQSMENNRPSETIVGIDSPDDVDV